MLLIQDKIVSDDLVREEFVCNLQACKGACCWEGDFGAPLETEERAILDQILPLLEPFLSPQGLEAIRQQGTSVFIPETNDYGTPLVDGAACAYMTLDEKGVAQCGIEKAWKAGAVNFRKPVSCHLYPIRVSKNSERDWEALNYDRWDICQAACSLGKSLKMPVYRFLREALIRKYGEAFYEELDEMASYLSKQENF